MDAELCRRLGYAKNSPWWQYKAGDNASAFTDAMIDAGLKAKTLDNLPENIKQFLDLCDRSMETARRLNISLPNRQELQRVIDAVIEEFPTIEETEVTE